jgi:ATP-dependent Clp protease ATP-binding subunit ClpB
LSQISDRALVVAAELADRYITNRFLPDKAIDLVDEACSNLQVRFRVFGTALEAGDRLAPVAGYAWARAGVY